MTYLQNFQKGETTLINRVIKMTHNGYTGLVTNIDGALSSLARTPGEAQVSPGCREALRKLSASGRFRVIAVISGRSALESRQLVGLAELHYIGNNGLEVLTPQSVNPQPVKAARPYLHLISIVLETIEYALQNVEAAELDLLEGPGWFNKLVFENKGFSASIHYRQFLNEPAIKKLLLEKVGIIVNQTGLSVEEGPKSLEIRPPIRVNKGTALSNLSELYWLNNLVYLGSDLGDLEAFKAVKQLAQAHHQIRQEVMADTPEYAGLNLAVCNPETPPKLVAAADYLVDGVAGVEKFLTECADHLE